MTRTSDILNFAQVILLAIIVIAAIFPCELQDLLLVALTDEFPDDSFRYIPTNVFLIIALALYFLLFYLLKNSKTSSLLLLF